MQELDDLRTTEQMYEGDAALLLAPQAALEGAGQLAVGDATVVLHFSLQAKAGADPNAPEMSGLRVQEEPSFSFGQELVRVNPVAAPVGTESNSRLDRVSFNLPVLVRAAGSIGRNNPPQLQGNNGQRFQPVEEPVFSTLRTTEPVEGCQPGSIVVLLTGYDTTGAVIATKEQLLPTACQWQPRVFRLPLREIGEGVHFISWRITNSGPSDVYLDELKLETVEVVQENHYYAFGGDLAGVGRSGKNKNKYLGIEEDRDLGVYMTDFRLYDHNILRFTSIDLMADKFYGISTYQYSFNNPVSLKDPTGLDPEYIYEDGEYFKIKKNGEKKNVDWEKVHKHLQKSDNLISLYQNNQGDPKGIATAFQHAIKKEAMIDATKDFIDEELAAGRQPDGVGLTSFGNVTYPSYFPDHNINLEEYVEGFRDNFATFGDLKYSINKRNIVIRFYASRRNKDILNVSLYAIHGRAQDRPENRGSFNSGGIPGLINGNALVLRNGRGEDIAFAVFRSANDMMAWRNTVYHNYYKKYYARIKNFYDR